MADYRHSIAKVLVTEGGYVNDPDDAGGETYKGIARNFWHNWVGWQFIDGAKYNPTWSKCLNAIPQLQVAVFEFYKENFWDKVGGDQIASQTIADNLVDSAVNEGIKPAVKRAQAIIGMEQTGVVSEELVTKLNSLV